MTAMYWDTTANNYKNIEYKEVRGGIGNNIFYTYSKAIRKSGYDFDYTYIKYYEVFNNPRKKRENRVKVV